jgi:hypothetical protein
MIGPHGYRLASCPTDGTESLVCVDRTDPDLDIALNKARPWRARSRAGHDYAARRVTDARSRDRTLFCGPAGWGPSSRSTTIHAAAAPAGAVVVQPAPRDPVPAPAPLEDHTWVCIVHTLLSPLAVQGDRRLRCLLTCRSAPEHVAGPGLSVERRGPDGLPVKGDGAPPRRRAGHAFEHLRRARECPRLAWQLGDSYLVGGIRGAAPGTNVGGNRG